jgi:hypothetical protein
VNRLDTPIARRRVARMERRVLFLQRRIALRSGLTSKSGRDPSGHDRAEESALRWLLDELKRLDKELAAEKRKSARLSSLLESSPRSTTSTRRTHGWRG